MKQIITFSLVLSMLCFSSCDKINLFGNDNNDPSKCPDWIINFGGGSHDGIDAVHTNSRNEIFVTAYTSSTTNYTGTNYLSTGISGPLFLKIGPEKEKLLVVNTNGISDFLIDKSDDILCISSGKGDYNFSSSVFNINDDGLILSKYSQLFTLDWAKSIVKNTADGQVFPSSVCLTQTDNIIVVGSFKGTVDFDPNNNHDVRVSNGKNDVFVMKLDPDGNFLWVKTLGAAGEDTANKVIVNKDNEIYLCGSFENNVDFDPGGSSFGLTSSGKKDNYILRLTPDVGLFMWAANFGTQENDVVTDIVSDAEGSIYIGGGNKEQFTAPDGNGIKYAYYADKFIYKVSNGLIPIWQKTFGEGIVHSLEISGEKKLYAGDNGLQVFDLDGKKLYAVTGVISTTDIQVDNTGNIYFGGNYKGEPEIKSDSGNCGDVLSNEAGFGYTDAFLIKLKQQ